MHNPFDSSDALIRDLPHVRVRRQAAPHGRRCRYEKIFKPEGLGEAGYWIQRENEFLLDFALKNLQSVVQLAAMVRDGDGSDTPVVASVVTLDAGVTIEDWLRVQPRYVNGLTGLHPFQHTGAFLLLLRACLTALREIHRLGIVHCDIKEDNICLPYSPYPFRPGEPVGIDYERIRLIDFAFSITPERPLQYPLPILPAAPYQSHLLKAALNADRRGKPRGTPVAQNLDYRADLYSLGYLAARILDTGLLQPAGPSGATAMNGARDLVERLLAADTGRWRGGRSLPHDAWLAEIDALLAPLKDLGAYRRFEIAHLRDQREPDPGTPRVQPTPLTPLASRDEPAIPPPIRPPRRGRLGMAGILAALAVTVLAGLGYWQAGRTPELPASPNSAHPGPDTAAKSGTGQSVPSMAGAARDDGKTRRDPEAAARARAEAERKAGEQARWKAEAEAALRAEAARTERESRPPPLEAETSAEDTPEQAETEAKAPAEQEKTPTAIAEIEFPGPGAEVQKAEAIRGTLQGLREGQAAFLVIRSTAAEFGRRFYPQAELPPYPAGWTQRGVFGTLDYDYQIFVVATANDQSAELLRSPRSRADGLSGLPGGTQVISKIVTVRRVR